MIYNYFTTAIRNMFRYKVHSVINMTGLTVGLVCCILMGGDLLALAGLLVFGVTFLVVGHQALKAATVNPVDNLRNE